MAKEFHHSKSESSEAGGKYGGGGGGSLCFLEACLDFCLRFAAGFRGTGSQPTGHIRRLYLEVWAEVGIS